MAQFYRTIDFRSATPGWRILWLEADGKITKGSLAGWLIEEVCDDDGRALIDTPAED